MKCINGALVAAAVLLFFVSSVVADGLPRGAKPIGKAVISVYDAKNKCRVICKGSKPFLEYVEDGLAYALDIPLAILSPFTCPIVSPIMDRIDANGGRSYSRYR
ncbi:MAG: hypothetical protein RDU20_06290 [Desulfomonilaceae bacterium]|nr:hypothetical protein [Desulfomonilaceae bacterium]